MKLFHVWSNDAELGLQLNFMYGCGARLGSRTAKFSEAKFWLTGLSRRRSSGTPNLQALYIPAAKRSGIRLQQDNCIGLRFLVVSVHLLSKEFEE